MIKRSMSFTKQWTLHTVIGESTRYLTNELRSLLFQSYMYSVILFRVLVINVPNILMRQEFSEKIVEGTEYRPL